VPGFPRAGAQRAVDPGPGGRLAVTELLARVAGSSVTANCPPTKEAAMSTWLWVLIIVVVVVLVFGVIRRRRG
jgi:cytochrome c-type biogenesis protein CcmH/NrfF